MRGVTAYMGSRLFPDIFQPALPVRGVTRYSTFWVIAVGFQPALPMRGVTFAALTLSFTSVPFQPALPMRGVTNGITVGTPVQLFISTRTPHAGSDLSQPRPCERLPISTRTPHAGSDGYQNASVQVRLISTRTPHAGSDAALTFLWVVSPFQPALPMRGVTHHGRYRRGRHRFQPALPMRGVTPRWLPRGTATTNFNPHSPCGE